jgi:hypothetical protein
MLTGIWESPGTNARRPSTSGRPFPRYQRSPRSSRILAGRMLSSLWICTHPLLMPDIDLHKEGAKSAIQRVLLERFAFRSATKSCIRANLQIRESYMGVLRLDAGLKLG